MPDPVTLLGSALAKQAGSLAASGSKAAVAGFREPARQADALKRADLWLQGRQHDAARDLLGEAEPTKLASIATAISDLRSDFDGALLRNALRSSLRAVSMRWEDKVVVEAASMLYGAILFALAGSESALQPRAEHLLLALRDERLHKELPDAVAAKILAAQKADASNAAQAPLEPDPSVSSDPASRFTQSGLTVVARNAAGHNVAFGDSCGTDGRWWLKLDFFMKHERVANLIDFEIKCYKGHRLDQLYLPVEGVLKIEERTFEPSGGLIDGSYELQPGRLHRVFARQTYFDLEMGRTSWTDFGRLELRFRFVEHAAVTQQAFLNPGGELLFDPSRWRGPELH